jgi:pilus assembly protein CpaB
MKKQQRTLIVMCVAVVTAAIGSYGIYRAVLQMPVREVEVASVPVVVAAQPLAMGTRLHANHLRVVAWPSRNPVAGAFADPKALVDRGVISPVAENEPITMSKVASLEAGAGLPPVIPEGMRAISVKVNEVVGVAGFVVPGTIVDVLVTVRATNGRPAPNSTRKSRRTVNRFPPRWSRSPCCPRMRSGLRWRRTKERSRWPCATPWTSTPPTQRA